MTQIRFINGTCYHDGDDVAIKAESLSGTWESEVEVVTDLSFDPLTNELTVETEKIVIEATQ